MLPNYLLKTVQKLLDSIENVCLTNSLSKADNDLFDNPTMYCSTTGALHYLSLTRPELSFSVNRLSQFLHQWHMPHLQACKCLLQNIKVIIHLGLHFKPSTTFNLHWFSYVDLGANPDDRCLTSGYANYMGCNLISWCAKMQPFVARSSTESEYMTLALTTSEITLLQHLFHEIYIP